MSVLVIHVSNAVRLEGRDRQVRLWRRNGNRTRAQASKMRLRILDKILYYCCIIDRHVFCCLSLYDRSFRSTSLPVMIIGTRVANRCDMANALILPISFSSGYDKHVCTSILFLFVKKTNYSQIVSCHSV
jgi:hypothetical protein